MATIRNEPPSDADDLTELAMIESELDELLVAPALNKLSDLLQRRDDRGSTFLKNNVTALIGTYEDLERARRSGGLSQRAFDERRNGLVAESKLLIRRVRVGLDPPAPGADGDGSNGEAPHDTPLRLGRSGPVPDESAVLHADGISKMHRSTSFRLLPMDIKVMPGKVLGIVGVNGSGKSTLLDILRGETAPDEGVVHYPQLSPDNRDWARIRPQIGYVPQRSVPWSGTVRASLEYACAVHRIRGDRNRERVDWLLARHGLASYQRHSWAQLSSGYRLRFDLVMARIHNPRLMIFDEPLANLDPVSQQTFLADLAQLARGEGGFRPGIVLTSQHLYELEAVADDIIVLSGGGRVPDVDDRPLAYFEIWGPNLTLDAVSKVFGGLMPERTAAAGQPSRDIRLGRTACIVAMRKGTTIDQVVAAAQTSALPLNYVRDITRSKRVDLDALVDEPARGDHA